MATRTFCALAGTLPALPVVLLLAAAPTQAGVRGPEARTVGSVPCDLTLRSVWELEPAPVGCQYRFDAAGDLDELTVIVTLRDCFDGPVADCDVAATLTPNEGTLEFCSCESPVQIAPTDAAGAVEFRYSHLGGRGSLSVGLTALCTGSIGLPSLELAFTTPDQNGSCEAAFSTGIIDLALWSAGLSSYRLTSDFNCDGAVGIVDLALWARGLGTGCP